MSKDAALGRKAISFFPDINCIQNGLYHGWQSINPRSFQAALGRWILTPLVQVMVIFCRTKSPRKHLEPMGAPPPGSCLDSEHVNVLFLYAMLSGTAGIGNLNENVAWKYFVISINEQSRPSASLFLLLALCSFTF